MMLCLVRKKGLEPPRREALEPKSSASTNSATFAQICVLEQVDYFSANGNGTCGLRTFFVCRARMKVLVLPI